MYVLLFGISNVEGVLVKMKRRKVIAEGGKMETRRMEVTIHRNISKEWFPHVMVKSSQYKIIVK